MPDDTGCDTGNETKSFSTLKEAERYLAGTPPIDKAPLNSLSASLNSLNSLKPKPKPSAIPQRPQQCSKPVIDLSFFKLNTRQAYRMVRG